MLKEICINSISLAIFALYAFVCKLIDQHWGVSHGVGSLPETYMLIINVIAFVVGFSIASSLVRGAWAKFTTVKVKL